MSWPRVRGTITEADHPSAILPATRFALAPMSGDIRALTGIALVAPLGLVLGAALAREPVRGTLLGATVFVVVVYAAVWLLGRPTAFEVHTGGLWGGFGWLYTRKGLLDLYVSRTDRLVLVRLRAGRPLLLTPERDEGFVDALRALSRG